MPGPKHIHRQMNKILPAKRLALLASFTMLLFSQFFFSQYSAASNQLVEDEIALQLSSSNVTGQQLRLKLGDTDFLAIYRDANSPKALGGVIFLHSMAAHPDWQAVISPLRNALTNVGWTTLSLQMPVLVKDAPIEQYVPLLDEAHARITAGIEYLHSKGAYNVVIVGHGLGATMGANFLASDNPSVSVVKAFIGIGLGVQSQISEFSPAQYIARLRMPVFDLFGSQDLDSVKTSARTRLLAARRSNNNAYRQTTILGADHFFTGMNNRLINRVKSWLKKYAPSIKLDTEEANKLRNVNKDNNP